MRISDWSSDVCSSDLATLPLATAERWAEQWGMKTVEAAEAGWSAPPPIDLSFAAEPGAEEWPDALSLAPRHRRLPRGQAVEEMPGFNEGGWWVQDLAASLPARLLGAGEDRMVRSEEHTSELQSLMRFSYAVFCLKKKIIYNFNFFFYFYFFLLHL